MGWMGFPSLSQDFGLPIWQMGKAEKGQEKQNQWDADQAQHAMNQAAGQADLNRSFQYNMSNTAWQRGMADMKKAGINPMLSVMKGGASAPTGASAASHAARGSAPAIAGNSAFNEARSTAASTRLARAQVDQVNSATSVNKATAKKITAETAKPEATQHFWDTLGALGTSAKSHYFGPNKKFFTPGESYLDKKVIKILKDATSGGTYKNRNPRSSGYQKR